MNILVLTGTYPQPDDGVVSATYTVQYFCEQWVKEGHNVLVIHNSSKFPKIYYYIVGNFSQKLAAKVGFNIPNIQSCKKIERNEKGVTVFRIPMLKIIPHSVFLKKQITSQVKQIVDILGKNKFEPDVMISHWVNPQLDLLLELKKIYPVRTSLVFHGDCNEANIHKHNIRIKINEIDAIGCRSLSYAKEVQKRLGLSKLPFVCYSGIPDNLISEKVDYRKYKKHFVYVGRLVKYKNVDAIIKALNIAFPDRNYLLDIIGSGGEFNNLKQLAKEFGIENNICFHGQLSRDKVFEIIKKAECFTMISDNEVFGMVYIEAMAMGCITIASKGGGVDGVIVDGENGFLCQEGNYSELAEIYRKIDSMTDDEKNLLSKKAIKTASNYTDSKIAKMYLNNVLEW